MEPRVCEQLLGCIPFLRKPLQHFADKLKEKSFIFTLQADIEWDKVLALE